MKFVCNTCVHVGKGSVVQEADARIHKDNNPDHQVVPADTDTETKIEIGGAMGLEDMPRTKKKWWQK